MSTLLALVYLDETYLLFSQMDKFQEALADMKTGATVKPVLVW